MDISVEQHFIEGFCDEKIRAKYSKNENENPDMKQSEEPRSSYDNSSLRAHCMKMLEHMNISFWSEGAKYPSKYTIECYHIAKMNIPSWYAMGSEKQALGKFFFLVFLEVFSTMPMYGLYFTLLILNILPQGEDFVKNRRFYKAMDIVSNHRMMLTGILGNGNIIISGEMKEVYKILDGIYELVKKYIWLVSQILSEEIAFGQCIKEKQGQSQSLRNEQVWLRDSYRGKGQVDAELIISLESLVKKSLEVCQLEGLGMYVVDIPRNAH